MEDKIAEKIHKRIDETHKLINDSKIIHAGNKIVVENLKEMLTNFITKVDNSIFDTEKGFIVATRVKFSSIFTQLKNQWFLIALLLVGILSVTWRVLAGK